MITHKCPGCGFEFHDEDAELDRQIAERVAEWTAECAARGWPVRGGRVLEPVAAELLCMRKRVLAEQRIAGTGPRYLHVNGSPLSYHLTELAAWETMQEKGDSWKP